MEHNEATEKLARYGELFEQARKLVHDDQAATVLVQELAKDVRMERIRRERGEPMAAVDDGEPEPATSRQLAYLRNLGVNVSEGLSKQEASEMIDAALAKAEA